MYQRNNSSRGFSSGSSRGGSSRGGGYRGGFRGGRGGGGGSQRPSGGGSYSRYINKAVEGAIEEVYVPKHKFADFPVDQKLKENIISKGYVTPTPIQDQAIPEVLLGKDLVGMANTGTGKTAAFLIPLIDKVLKNRKEEIIIMVPTRELATQIDTELREFTKNLKIFSVICVGGVYIGKQLKELRYMNNFIIGTPGRINDLIERKALDMKNFKTVVLDEADRMLDMGFIDDMKRILAMMPKEKQTLFFSATMTKDIEAIIKDFMKSPTKISVKTSDTSKNVDQDIVRIERGADKVDVLSKLLVQEEFSKVIVFGRTKHGVEKIHVSLLKRGIRSVSIHGDKRHKEREVALNSFKQNKAQVMVATDVAARGIDVSDITHVINYEIPQTYEDYIHRIGRTGRAGKKGKALTFIG